ncbi:uncharacterized protein IUM83_14544 [Phytophthora cinnamomi]|uniref:uncharacterized protein n=1 Tax=Phytophthora cinnamomi TaxID=4785 RepID=UPI00355A12CD|nr:hypothetical protein IUM83_14544 [Phytophthora cinnamomi]
MEKHDVAMAVTKPFKMVAPAREDVVEWVAAAWSELSADTIANGFKGVLHDSEEDEATKRQVNNVVVRLEQLYLLNKRMGEVVDEQDYADRVVDDIEYADV